MSYIGIISCCKTLPSACEEETINNLDSSLVGGFHRAPLGNNSDVIHSRDWKFHLMVRCLVGAFSFPLFDDSIRSRSYMHIFYEVGFYTVPQMILSFSCLPIFLPLSPCLTLFKSLQLFFSLFVLEVF